MPANLVVDPNSGVPVFRQIVDQLRFHVASGLLEPGEELPSTRALSQELGVNPMTVSKAFVLLEQERLVERRPGLPLVVRRLGHDAVERERLDLLRTTLEPAVLAARQLGVSATRAAALLRQMLSEANE
ncbi:MAG TPA: GntR family transcriptional regulator [Longimicrobiales bacterium]